MINAGVRGGGGPAAQSRYGVGRGRAGTRGAVALGLREGGREAGYASRMERTEKPAEPDVQHTQDIEERDEQRRKDDTKAGARHPDTGWSDDPPEPFSGSLH
jgi:hypothetical protein